MNKRTKSILIFFIIIVLAIALILFARNMMFFSIAGIEIPASFDYSQDTTLLGHSAIAKSTIVFGSSERYSGMDSPNWAGTYPKSTVKYTNDILTNGLTLKHENFHDVYSNEFSSFYTYIITKDINLNSTNLQSLEFNLNENSICALDPGVFWGSGVGGKSVIALADKRNNNDLSNGINLIVLYKNIPCSTEKSVSGGVYTTRLTDTQSSSGKIQISKVEGNFFNITDANGMTTIKQIPAGVYELVIYSSNGAGGSPIADSVSEDISVSDLMIVNEQEIPPVVQPIPGQTCEELGTCPPVIAEKPSYTLWWVIGAILLIIIALVIYLKVRR